MIAIGDPFLLIVERQAVYRRPLTLMRERAAMQQLQV
jgi:hypothetical protein